MSKTKLQQLYDRIPKIVCPPWCTRCCGPVMLNKEEAKAIGVTGNNTGWVPDTYKCKFATHSGCSVYENRPFTCRVFGCSSDGPISCKYVEEGATLSHSDSFKLMLEYFEICAEMGDDRPPTDEELLAIHKHDVLNGFRSEEDNPLLTIPDLLPRLSE